MSRGRIVKPEKPDLPDNLMKKPLEDAIYHVVQTCHVRVDDTDWKSADAAIDQSIAILIEKLESFDKRLGDNQGSLSDAINKLNDEIKNSKIRRPLDLIVKVGDTQPVDLGNTHKQLPVLLQILSTKLNAFVVGPAGSGKTHAAKQCADALGVPFHFTGAVASEFKLTGFVDAQGRIVSTEFRKAFEDGGLFLFDEIDASYPQAVLAFNAALANDFMDFPDKRVARHENFYCVAAANTYGQGADRQYVGRNQLDAASLDRFVFVDWAYDENLERALAGNDEWVEYVQKVRDRIAVNKIRHVVSPRASIAGAKLLAIGLSQGEVEDLVLWKGLDKAVTSKIKLELAPTPIKANISGHFIPSVKEGDFLEAKSVVGKIRFERKLRYYYDEVEVATEDVMAGVSGRVISIEPEAPVVSDDIVAVIQL